MDRAKPEALAVAPGYIPANVTVGEFMDKIEPAIGYEAARRLRGLLENYLDWPMQQGGIDVSIPGGSADDDGDDD